MSLRISIPEPARTPATSTTEELLDAKGNVIAEGKASREPHTRKGSFVVEGKADLDDLANRVHSLRLPGLAPFLVIRATREKGETKKLDLIFSVIS